MDRELVLEKISEIGKMYNLIERTYITPETKFDFEVKVTESYGKLTDGRWCFIDSFRIEVYYFNREVSQEAIYTVTKLAEIYSYLHSKEHGNKISDTTPFNY